MKLEFASWLKSKGLSDSSVSKYSSGYANRIFSELHVDIYSISNMEALGDLLIKTKEWESKMERNPNRAYSSTVSNYIKFLVAKSDSIDAAENDDTYSIQVEEGLGFDILPPYELYPKPPTKLITGESSIYQRNYLVSVIAIKLADFNCQFDCSNERFISKVTNRNYVEAHHLIPMAYQGLFEYSIDVVPNIVCLCPLCHKRIHHAVDNQRKEMIIFFLNMMRAGLQKVGISVKQEDILEFYKITK